ncbi:hypothetical protein [Aquimarina algiphila]|uniref:hypothetical protein n=1 Tax=Aquimarina algiphila TaxID=2047982 RepID=UPI00232E8CCC|nr:hypothetical protein [Aquimarina algiphila]
MKNYTFFTTLILTVLLLACSQNDNEFQTTEFSIVSKHTQNNIYVTKGEYIKTLERDKNKCRDSVLSFNEELLSYKVKGAVSDTMYCESKFNEKIEWLQYEIEKARVYEYIEEFIGFNSIDDDDTPCPEFNCPIQYYIGDHFIFLENHNGFKGEILDKNGELLGIFTELEPFMDSEFFMSRLHLKREIETKIEVDLRFAFKSESELNQINISDVVLIPSYEEN